MPSESVPQRRCKTCSNEYPLTSEFWHKDKTAKYGFTYSCKSCAKARSRKYGQDNRNEVLEKHRIYYLEHLEERKAYNAVHQQEQCDYKRQWRAANPDKVKKHKSDSQKRNRKSASIRNQRYAKRHPEKMRVKSLQEHQRRKNTPGHFTDDDVQLQYKSQNGKCWWCSKEVGDTYHIDHLIPITRGGTNDPRNIVISCPHCNWSRNNRLPHEWGDRLF